ncbi:MAG: hypothetical protein GY803_19945 [Chloroflexi bacterium]|nr:hypothetical protein [Chloroflexota bacterium]
MVDVLALANDVLQAIIVIFGSAVVLYHLGRSLRVPVIRAFSALIAFVVIVYLTELLVSRTIISGSAETWLRFGWIGIALVPAAQYQLADALLTLTGAPSRRRRFVMFGGYLIGLIFLGLVLWTDWIAADLVMLPRAPHLTAGPLFPLFAIFFWAGMAASIHHVLHARRRTVTHTTRRRITTTLLAFWAAPLAVFPYLVISGSPSVEAPLIFWPVVILGNLVVGSLFGVMTSHLSYFGAVSPDRVVRVRLFKFMARVPLAGTIVLLVYVLISRSSPILGLPTETALGFALVMTVMLVEWLIHAYKRPLERLFQLNNDPDVYRIQRLSERLLTTSDLRQFLESVLAAACEAFRTPTAFVAAIAADGPKLEAVIGPLAEPETILQDADWKQLAQNGNDAPNLNLKTAANFILWQNYWIRPLYNRQNDAVLGIFGLRARTATPDLDEMESALLERLLEQAASALEDRILQQQVFAAVEGILPQITALQERRGAAEFGGLPILTASSEPTEDALVNDPGFTGMVRDALTHYWGGPKLTESPLMRLQIVQRAMEEHGANPTNALRAILQDAIELQKPEGERNLSRVEWLLYNILEMKFVQGKRVRDVARRLAMSESDLYRKQRVAIENVARTIEMMETSVE